MVELNRAHYLDEEAGQRSERYAECRQNLQEVLSELVQAWFEMGR